MILVTVGTHWFDELIEVVDVAVGAGAIESEVLLQTGFGGAYTPRFCRYVTIVPTLAPFYAESTLVVGHGGTGTTLEVLFMGKPLISVANPMMKDNHQDEFLNALEAEGMVAFCRDLSRLPEMINGFAFRKKTISAGARLASAISADIRGARPRTKRPDGLLSRMAGRLIKRCEIDPRRTERQSSIREDVFALVKDPRNRDQELVRE